VTNNHILEYNCSSSPSPSSLSSLSLLFPFYLSPSLTTSSDYINPRPFHYYAHTMITRSSLVAVVVVLSGRPLPGPRPGPAAAAASVVAAPAIVVAATLATAAAAIVIAAAAAALVAAAWRGIRG
jgi:hypothetical protein